MQHPPSKVSEVLRVAGCVLCRALQAAAAYRLPDSNKNNSFPKPKNNLLSKIVYRFHHFRNHSDIGHDEIHISQALARDLNNK